MKSIFKSKIMWLVVIILLLFIGGYASLFFSRYYNSQVIFGVSFDPGYASYLGLDPNQVFRTISEDWQFRLVRLSAHWNEVEPIAGRFNFVELDKLMFQAEKRQLKVMLAIGQKTPRWPECHTPDWAAKLPSVEYHNALNNYITTVVKRYQNSPALEIWQVENEPFLPFGVCPSFSQKGFIAELTLVKNLDPVHPLVATDSGELSTWLRTARATDLFGTTMYRTVWNKYLGYVSYNWIPAAFYRLKLWLVGRPIASAYVVELQAEPWLPGRNINAVSLTEQFKSLSLAQFKTNIEYARQAGLSRAYLWGVEWWYWLGKQGNNEFIDFIKTLKKE